MRAGGGIGAQRRRELVAQIAPHVANLDDEGLAGTVGNAVGRQLLDRFRAGVRVVEGGELQGAQRVLAAPEHHDWGGRRRVRRRVNELVELLDRQAGRGHARDGDHHVSRLQRIHGAALDSHADRGTHTVVPEPVGRARVEVDVVHAGFLVQRCPRPVRVDELHVRADGGGADDVRPPFAVERGEVAIARDVDVGRGVRPDGAFDSSGALAQQRGELPRGACVVVEDDPLGGGAERGRPDRPLAALARRRASSNLPPISAVHRTSTSPTSRAVEHAVGLSSSSSRKSSCARRSSAAGMGESGDALQRP